MSIYYEDLEKVISEETLNKWGISIYSNEIDEIIEMLDAMLDLEKLLEFGYTFEKIANYWDLDLNNLEELKIYLESYKFDEYHIYRVSKWIKDNLLEGEKILYTKYLTLEDIEKLKEMLNEVWEYDTEYKFEKQEFFKVPLEEVKFYRCEIINYLEDLLNMNSY